MAYIGSDPSNRFVAPKAASVFSGDGSTTAFTLDHAVGSDEDILVSVDGVIQEPSVAYAVSSGTTLTFTAAPSSNSGNNIFVYYLFRTVGTVSHPSNNALTASTGTFSGAVSVSGATTISDDLTIADKIIHSGDTNTAIRFADADTVTIETGGTERLRVLSSGNVLVGTTDASPAEGTNVGVRLGGNGTSQFSSAGDAGVQVNRTSDDGNLMRFFRDGSAKAQIASSNGGNILGLQSGGSGLGVHISANIIYPVKNNSTADDNIDLGSSGVRFDDVFATNTSIQTSDKNEKQDIEELNDAEKKVAVAVKSLMRKYRWKSAVTKKGDDARIHFGIIAQDLQDAFKAEGLDASKYAMFCSDTWYEKEISVDAVKADKEKGIEAQDAYTYTHHYVNGEEVPSDATKKTRLGVRYSELLAFIISAI